MSIGDALSKYWTYGKIDEQARVRAGAIKEDILHSTLAYDVITQGVQRIAQASKSPLYITTVSTLTITGSANPYSVDLSSVSPFPDQIIKVTHVSSGGTRTPARQVSAEEAEGYSSITSTYADSLLYVLEGDSLRFYKKSDFTITTASDTVEIKHIRQPKTGTITSASVVGDTPWTASGITITAFTGMTTSLVGGTFVGTDNGANKFARTITKYISSTSFEISSALVSDGAGTNGYIIPPASNTAAVTSGTYVDLPDSLINLLIDEVTARYKVIVGNPDKALETAVDNQLNGMRQ